MSLVGRVRKLCLHGQAWAALTQRQTRTKTHTYLERNQFFWRGAPATKNICAFWAHSGRPRHRKIRYFWHPGALSQKHTHTLAPGGYKHTHGLHTNTHTDCTKHTHGMHINTHLLLPIVVFAVKTRTKTHTDLERKTIFLLGDSPAIINIIAFGGHPGRLRHRKIR